MKNLIAQEIISFVDHYQKSEHIKTSWRKPLTGFADARDPLFSELKSAVSPTHAMPHDLLEGARSIVAYFLPFEESVSRINKKDYYAAKEWAIAYMRRTSSS